METKKKITLGIGGVVIILMGSSIVMDMFSKPTKSVPLGVLEIQRLI